MITFVKLNPVGTVVLALLLTMAIVPNSYSQSQFESDQTYQISVSAKGAKKYLAIAGGQVRRGVPAILWDDVDQDDIRWVFEPVQGSIYKIRNRKTGLYMAVAGGGRRLGARIVQWPDVGQRDVTWFVQPQPGGKFKLRNRGTGRFLAVAGGRIANGQEAVQWSDVGQADLIWNIELDQTKPGDRMNLSSSRDAVKFGFRSQRKLTEIPVLLVLSEFQDRTLDESLEFYDGMIFGPSFPNVVDQFQAYAGRNVFRRAGTVKILHRHSWQNIPSNFDAVVTRRGLAASGLDIDKFDTDGNGTITRDELAILSINSNLRTNGFPSAQTRGVRTSFGGKRIDATISSCHHTGDVNLYAHELFHLLGSTVDLYGPGSFGRPRTNERATVMSMHFGRNQSPGPIFLDPYNRIRSGWLLPRVYYPTDTRTRTTISAYPDAAFSRSPVILHNESRSQSEFFILEYRSPDLVEYDKGGLSAGLAIWYVQVDNAGRPVDFSWPPPVAPLPPRTGSMGANYIIGVGNTPARGPHWTVGTDAASLVWGDGSDSGIRVRVASTSSDEAVVEWWRE